MPDHKLTTVDNPYDPWTQWDEWYQWDYAHGYHTPSFLARITVSSHEMSEADQEQAIEVAVQEIVRENVTGLYRAVPKPANLNPV